MSQKSEKKAFWEYPWKLGESFTIAFTILFMGFILEYLSPGTGPVMPRWPMNLYIILSFTALTFVAWFGFKNSSFIKWISGTSAAISAISVITFLILIMGFISQGGGDPNSLSGKLGLHDVTSGWPYFLVSFYLLLVLSFAIWRRLLPFSLKNLAFFLNHAGLFMMLIAASMGSADVEKRNMRLLEGRAEFNTVDDFGNVHQMPFAIKLIDFKIEEYPPKIGLMDKSTSTFLMDKDGMLPEVYDGLVFQSGDWEICVSKYLPLAAPDSLGFIPSNEMGAVPALFVMAENKINQKKAKGWVSNGSFNQKPVYLHLSGQEAVVLSIAAPKEFSSDIRFFRSMDDYEDFTIKVNQPVSIAGWDIYQIGYNEKMGRWSQISILQMVRDPWLPAVYTGIFMVLLGSVYLVWMGKNKKQSK